MKEDIRVARKTATVIPSTLSIQQAKRQTRNSTSPSYVNKEELARSQNQSTQIQFRYSQNEEAMQLQRRPKRQVLPSMPRYTAGITWKEEKDLKRALLASLQDNQPGPSSSFISYGNTTMQAGNKPMNRTVSRLIKRTSGINQSTIKSAKHYSSLTRKMLLKPRRTKRLQKSGTDTSSITSRYSIRQQQQQQQQFSTRKPSVLYDSQQDSSETSDSSQITKFAYMCAQRKFAQNSRPNSPCVTPTKNKPVRFFTTSKAKTEDFLTFLCLRGSPLLPPHLDFYHIDDSDENAYSSLPGTPKTNSQCSSYREQLHLDSMASSKDPSPDREFTDNDLGIHPLNRYEVTPTCSPKKGVSLKSNRSSLTLPLISKREKKAFNRNLKNPPQDSVKASNNRYKSDCPTSPMTRAQCATSKETVLNTHIDSEVPSRRPSIQSSRRLLSKAKTFAARVKRRRVKRELSVSPEIIPARKCRSTATSNRARSQNTILKENASDSVGDIKMWTETISDSEDEEILLRRNNTSFKEPTSNESGTDVRCTDSSNKDSEQCKRKKRSKSKKEKRKRSHDGKRHRDKEKKKKSKSKHKRDKKHRHRSKKKRSKSESSSCESSITSTSQHSFETDKETIEGWSTDSRLDTVMEEEEIDVPPRCTTDDNTEDSIISQAFRCSSPYRGGFPGPNDPAQLIDVPTYHPSMEQFQDPISYIQSIRPDAEPYGMCTIVPPDGWKPECEIRDDMRFTCHIQYIHRMLNRWGPNTIKFECLKKHLESQNIKLEQAPMMSGVEIDLPSLHEFMRHFGGLESVMEKNKWAKVIDALKIPKVCHNSTSRLYECYCKYLVSYDTLSRSEKDTLEQQVNAERTRKRNPVIPECIVKCKSRPLDEFFKYAKFSEAVWFNEDPSEKQVEEKYWKLLSERRKHISIHSGQLDTSVYGSGFPTKKDSPYSKHGWNLTIMQDNPKSLLSHIAPLNGLTTPTLQANMLFTTNCWSRDLHLLPYVTYHHTGAKKIWYCVPVSEEDKFHKILKDKNPNQISNKHVWLQPDEVMVPPSDLIKHGLSVGRTVQQCGEFVVVFSHSFTSSISCGYSITESLKFAPPDWIESGCLASKALYASGLVEMFSIELLIFTLVKSECTSVEMLKLLLPHLQAIVQYELDLRSNLYEIGLTKWERLEQKSNQGTPKRQRFVDQHHGSRCEISKKICYLSMVCNEENNNVWCLQNASSQLRRMKLKSRKLCRLLYRWDEKELNEILEKTRNAVQNDVSQVKNPMKFS